MTKRIVFNVPPAPFCPSGSVVLFPYAPRNDGEIESAYLARVHAETIAKWIRDGKLPPGDYPMTVIDHAEIPTDRSYRNAWTFEGKAFGHDMAKAKELHRDKIRLARAPLLEALDLEFMRNLEKGGDNKPVAAEKQRLRDATAHPSIEAAKTIAELKSAWPL